MTINAAFTKDQQQAAAGDTTFSVPFQYDLETDLRVYLTPNGQSPDDVADILILNSDYTVTGAGWGQSNRFVTLANPASVGDIITLTRDMPIGRTVDLTLGDFTALDINNQFDSIIGMIQQINTDIQKLGLTYNETEVLKSSGSQNTLPKLPPNTGAGIPIFTANSAGDLVAGSIVEGSDATTLRSELINDQNSTDGSRIVGYENPSASPTNTTVHNALDELYSRPSNNDIQTGDLNLGFKSIAPPGWILYNDGYLGSAAAVSPGDRLENFGPQFEALYGVIWDNVGDNFAPVIGGRGASAAADFASNKPLGMPLMLARSLGVAGLPGQGYDFTTNFVVNAFHLIFPSTFHIFDGMQVEVTTTGVLPSGLLPATKYFISVISNTQALLSLESTQYTDGNPLLPDPAFYVQLADNGVGTHTLIIGNVAKQNGQYEGHNDHVLTRDELTKHNHTYANQSAPRPSNGFGVLDPALEPAGGINTTDTAGSSLPFSIVSSSSYVNLFIKL